MVGFVRRLIEKLFGTEKQLPDEQGKTPVTKKPSIQPSPSTHTPSTTKKSPIKEKPSNKPSKSAHLTARTDPYFIQIGFDFGTSYSKCICRDIMTNKAWVHLNPGSDGQELPFLIPSCLSLNKGRLVHIEDPGIHYPENGFCHMKHALVKVARQEWDDPVLLPFRAAARKDDLSDLSSLVEACAVYFLAGALGEVRRKIRARFPEFGAQPEDYMAVNLAVPIGDVEMPDVAALYNRVLREAWSLADDLSGHPPIRPMDMNSLLKECQTVQNEACFIYPEVSANVQGFVRSRVSSPGVYLFSDTGGGTVDQSVFIFTREGMGEHLLYLTGRVLPLGSSHIERLAAQNGGGSGWQDMETWRERKESGGDHLAIKKAKGSIAKELVRGTETTLALAKSKLYVKEQLNSINVIFGGGGHCDYPYKAAAMTPFSGPLFRKSLNPDVVGMPIPRDLEISNRENRWMRRLSVAYGLSFEKSELARFTYPKDVSTPKADEIWQPRKRAFHAPDKDEC